jgi:hypothetical protein
MWNKDSRTTVFQNVSLLVGGLVLLPIILGVLIGDSANTLGFAIGILGPIFLFSFVLYCVRDDPRAMGVEEFWVGVWFLFVYFTSMFITWYHSTDQVFLLEYTEKILEALTR